ncbi:MAG: ribonuclease HII, partial [Oscillospiraceae bacterium]
MTSDLYAFDADYKLKYGAVCGVDEAGRGPLCGPVCVAAVILDESTQINGINDSKKLSEKKREALYGEIIKNAVSYQIVFVEPQIIDEINILRATMLGMKNAVEGLSFVPSLALIDGNRCPDTDIPTQYVIKGDAFSASIAAASILAKVTRDRYMINLAQEYPQYQLEKHKGYPTKLHYELLDKYGIQSFYRKSFLKNRG